MPLVRSVDLVGVGAGDGGRRGGDGSDAAGVHVDGRAVVGGRGEPRGDGLGAHVRLLVVRRLHGYSPSNSSAKGLLFTALSV